MWRAVAVLAFAALCSSLPAQDTAHSENELDNSSSIVNTDCLKKDSATCLQYKFFSYVDKMIGEKENFSISDGITVVRASDAPVETGAPRSMDPLTRLKSYLENHTLRIEVKGADVVNSVTSTARGLEDAVFSEDNEVEGRRRRRKNRFRMLGPLIMAMMAKKMALALGVIALIAGKALLTGKIALLLSSIIGLKKLLSQKKEVTYEVVAHPHHTSSHTSSHDFGGSSGFGGDSGGYGGGSSHGSSWGRSLDPQTLAYSTQMPQ